MVVYTDLDGTMLGPAGSFLHAPNGEHTLEPVQALIDARRAGIEIVPTSGRALRGLQTDARILGLSTVIAEMGAQISLDFGHELIPCYGRTPAIDDLPPARVMERLGIVNLLLEAFADKLEFHLPWSAWRECTQLFRGLVDTDEVDGELGDAGFDWLSLHDNGRLHGAYLGLEQGQSRAYHLIPNGVSKGAAVLLDRERRGLAPEQTVAIGDAHADVALADAVGWCVIVGDAVEHDPTLAATCAARDDVAITERPQNLGWTDLIRTILAGR